MTDENAIEIVQQKKATTELAPAQLAKVMESEAKKRAMITKYISVHMKEGADYGTIKIGGRDSKPSLFKPGSEKFLSLFKLTAKFEKDSETWEMAGSKEGVFAYKCSLVASNGNVVGEGRGAATMQEKQWSLNTCIKIAEKRAQIDAVLRTGALSDFFTQDLEDMPKEDLPKTKMKPYEVRRTNANEGEAESEWKDLIRDYMQQLGFKSGVKKIKEVTGYEAIPENYRKIADALREKIEGTNPIAQVISNAE